MRPYTLADRALWKRGDGPLVEVPVTTMPFLRLPFHASFNLALKSLGMGNLLFNMGFFCTWRTSTPINYVFHACELADMGGDKRLAGHWGLGLPVEQRVQMADELLKKITRRYEVAPTRAYARNAQWGAASSV